ncbi:MAG TPA: hypothetical protein VMR98_04135, partial [Candidatus Polarisedimenticolaceae bacterium]|nr:hypothetical protein [Candidatus Polarisedimenticolaceae bacterium]
DNAGRAVGSIQYVHVDGALLQKESSATLLTSATTQVMLVAALMEKALSQKLACVTVVFKP